MSIGCDIALSVILLAAGYYATCFQLSGLKWDSRNYTVLIPSKNKIFYLIFGIFAASLLIVLFNTIYHNNLISQLRLLTLVLIILPTAAVDYRLQKIPNKFMLAALISRCIFYVPIFFQSTQSVWQEMKESLLGAVIIGGFFFVLLLVFKNSVGMGDVKLFAIIGLYQGLWGAVNSVFFSLTVSFLVSIILLITKKKSRKDTISFGPSILIGTIVAIGLSGI